MKKNSMAILQALVVLVGIGALILMLWEPQLEGRNAHATLFEIYFNDPFLAYAYIASIPFFAGLYQAFKLFGHVGQGALFSSAALHAVRWIKYCGMAVIGFVAGAEIFIMLGESDDRAGGVAIGLFLAVCFAVIAMVASRFERNLWKTVKMEVGK